MTPFVARTHQNEHLPVGAGDVDAVITIAAGAGTGAARSTARNRTAVVIIIDTSGSMAAPRSKIREARKAAVAAVRRLRDGVLFAVIAGDHLARLVYPATLGLVPADERTRAEAEAQLRRLDADGGTSMSAWLQMTRRLLAPYEGALRQAILLTDGKNESESRATLEAELEECRGVFQCDCRGVGTDWSVEELRTIASSLLGTVDIIAEPAGMAADFEAIIGRTMGRHAADVRLRIATPPGATVRYVKQVAPSIDDLTARGAAVGTRAVEYATGGWGEEERDYHVAITVPPHAVGDELLVARIEVVADGEAVAQTVIRAIWTDEPATSTIIHPRVAHYTGQADLAAAIQAGLAARAEGDTATATRELGRAAQLAHDSHHDDTLRLLATVVDIDDASTGTVRLKRQVSPVDEMTLDTRSTATVRVRST